MFKMTFLGAIVLALSASSHASAQCEPQWQPGPVVPGVSATIYTMRPFTVSGSTSLYVAGDFSLVGSQPANRIASWNGSSWTPLDPGMPREEYGAILAMTEFEQHLIIAGGFTTINNGQPANHIAQWDGTNWSPIGSGDGPAGNQINALTVWNGQLVAGSQDYLKSGAVGYVSVWDGQSWNVLGPTMNELIYALTVHNGQLIAAGEFTEIDGKPINRIARWNGTSWEPMGDGFDQRVTAFAELNGELIAGGWFMNSGTPVRSVARWDGAAWQPFGNGPSGSAFAIGIYQGAIVASGSSDTFTERWNGAAWEPLAPEPDGYAQAIVEFAGSLYAGGFFRQSGASASMSNIGRWDGSQWNTVGDVAGFNFYVDAFGTFNDALVVGGSFTAIDGKSARGVARLNGSTWESLGDHNMVGVRDLAEYNGDLYACGFFRAATGAPADYIVRWDGSAWHPLGAGVNGTVNALAVHDGDLYVGGNFTVAGGVPRQRIARWDGSNWESVGTGLNNNVWDLISYNGSIVAGGTFTIDDGAPSGPDRGGVASFSPDSGWSLVGGGTSGTVSALAIYNNELIAVGMHEAGDTEVNQIARWDGKQWNALGNGIQSGSVDALATYAGELIVGGHFLEHQGDPGNFIARWDGASWHDLDGGLDDRVLALHEFNGVLYVGGFFALADGAPSAFIARAAATAASPGDTNCDGQVNVDDLLAVINGWGPCPGCPGDLTGNGVIDVDDLLVVINNWTM